jgi:hypothetical protein
MQFCTWAQFTFFRLYYKRDTSKGLLSKTLISYFELLFQKLKETSKGLLGKILISYFELLFQKLLQLISHKMYRPIIDTIDDRVFLIRIKYI